MVSECRYGQMGPNIKVSGLMTRHRAREHFGMQMGTSMKVISRMIKLKGTVCTRMLMGVGMRDTGSMISKMGTGERHGLMGQLTSGVTKKAKSMVMGFIIGQMERHTMGLGLTM
jgi:hypothetical protein